MGALREQSEIAADQLGDYLVETKRPLVCLAFLAPLLAFYELGVMLAEREADRNGADILLRNLLDQFGVEYALVLPVAICLVLLAWHHVSGQSWSFRLPTLFGMAFECVVLGIILLLIAQLQKGLMGSTLAAAESTAMISASSASANESSFAAEFHEAVSYLGAGIYEELLFRLLILSLLVWIATQLVKEKWQAITLGVVASSLLFVAAHYQPLNPAGYAIALEDVTCWYGMTFRFAAGVFFAFLFLRRGFGVAVGAHAAYDLLIHFT